MNPFFSVVIPLYNKANFVEACLNSVLQQSFQDFEIIVVNDGSTDNSLAKVKSIKDSQIKVISQKNQGVSVARNHGISIAEGTYIALLDADDNWYPHHLLSLSQLIQKYPEAGLYGDRYEIRFENSTKRLSAITDYIKEKPVLIKDYFKESLTDPILWTSACAFKKDTFYDIGEFDPKLRTAQDLDFFVRGALKFPVAFHPKVGIQYIKDSENNLAKSKYNSDRLYFISKYKSEEQQHPSLKHYMDINRYALVIRCQLDGDVLWKDVISEIDLNHLNSKQKILLKLPPSFLKVFKRIQSFLLGKGIYITAFK